MRPPFFAASVLRSVQCLLNLFTDLYDKDDPRDRGDRHAATCI